MDFTWGRRWSRPRHQRYEFRTAVRFSVSVYLLPRLTARTYVRLFRSLVHSPSSLLSCNEPLVSYLRLPHRSSCRAFLPCPSCPIPTAAGHCIALNIIVKVLPRVGIRHRSDDLRYCIVAELYTELCISPPSFRLLIRSASLG